MIQFQCDYNEGCHPHIMQRLVDTNLEQTIGYGEDYYCQEAKVLIKTACKREDIDVHFLVGKGEFHICQLLSWGCKKRSSSVYIHSISHYSIKVTPFLQKSQNRFES